MSVLKNTNLRYNLRWLQSCLIFLYATCSFLFTACGNTAQQTEDAATATADSVKNEQRIKNAFLKIDSAAKNIRSGDLIVRTGNDFTSESLRSLNQRDKTYSHCGIASIENDTLYVYHALGGEWNPDQRILRDKFKNFAAPYSNRGFGIYRYALDASEINSLMVTTKQLHSMGIMFDMKFDLATHDRMYCAEFVYKTCVMGTNGKLQFSTSQLGDFTFIGVDDLFLQPLCRLQQKILYR